MNSLKNDDKKNTVQPAEERSLDKTLKKKAELLGVVILDKAPARVDKANLKLISEDVARKYNMAVFGRDGQVLKVAMVNPDDMEAQNVLRFIAEKERLAIELYLASPEVLENLIKNYGTAEKAIEDAVHSLASDDFSDFNIKVEETEKVEEVIHDAPVSKLVQVVINHAIEGRASDIHIEPLDTEYRVRFRVDGLLHSSLTLPKEVGRAVVSRIKILSNLKIDEKRKPQDGRFKINDRGKIVDFRVSTFPVIDGEKLVIRVLDREEGMISFDTLGLVGRSKEILEREIKNTHGIVIISGPTGSGKSTTLYAFLQVLNKEERNIVTLEDPIEYYVEGVNQSQIKPEIGYTFANGLRSILRQDPNIIMVGEIRDGETAEMAIHAALTGHLVFSTLHTNNAIGAIPRLIDMGIEPFLLSASLSAVAAQRLVRKICPDCKEEANVSKSVVNKIIEEIKQIPPEELKKNGVDLSSGIKFYQGKGCDQCGNVGLRGRIAIFEVLEINQPTRDIIADEKGNEAGIRKEAQKQGMITLRQDGILKVLNGITTLEEVERVTTENQDVKEKTEDNQES